MNGPPVQPRFATAAAVTRLSAMLGLPPADQDWEVEAADPRRVAEFLDAYEAWVLDDDERVALMGLAIASYDELLDAGRDDPRHWGRMRRHLLDRFDLHGHAVQYWSLPDEDDPREGFGFTGRAWEVMAAAYGPRERWPRRPVVVKRYLAWPDPVVPGVPLDTMDVSDGRDGAGYTLWWSAFGGRAADERTFPTVEEAVRYAADVHGVEAERWRDV
jgi:hypothetical protein